MVPGPDPRCGNPTHTDYRTVRGPGQENSTGTGRDVRPPPTTSATSLCPVEFGRPPSRKRVALCPSVDTVPIRDPSPQCDGTGFGSPGHLTELVETLTPFFC